MLIFDLDGTLVHTREAVRLAYHDVGVTMPVDAYGKPWRAWLPQLVGEERAADVHARKGVAYEARLHAVRTTGVAQVARGVVNFCIVTGASVAAVRLMLVRVLFIDPDGVLVYAELDAAAKLRILDVHCRREPSGVFFEDEAGIVEGARTVIETAGALGWSVCRVH